MRKRVLLLTIVLMSTVCIAFAHMIPITTSCGKSTSLKASDYKDMDEYTDALLAVDKALCPENWKEDGLLPITEAPKEGETA